VRTRERASSTSGARDERQELSRLGRALRKRLVRRGAFSGRIRRAP